MASLARADEQLARRAAAGDASAFTELYQRYERRVFGLAYRLTGSADDAADATQDAFVKLLEKLPRADEPVRNFASYVLTVARNASFDVIARRRRADPVDEVPEPARPEPVAPEQDPERAALLAAAQSQVERANARLEPRHREVLALREAEELSYDEIAEVMGMNRNSVAQLILRARTALRRELRRGAVASIAPVGPDCERALPLICARQDDERVADTAWLLGHLRACDRCRLASEELADVARSYRAWTPLPVLAGLQELVFGRVAEAFGFGWAGGAGATGASGGTGQAAAAAKAGGVLAGQKAVVTAVLAAALAAGGGLAVVAVGGDSSVPQPALQQAAPAAEPEAAASRTERATPERARARRIARRRAARRRARAEAAAQRPAQAPVATEPAPATQAAPAPEPAPAEPAPVPAPSPAPEPEISPEIEVTPE
jgi:RNA polymerase sigma-70 factor (ECF subfamily)